MSDNIIHKAKITTNMGTFEFEGSETFVSGQVKSALEAFKNTDIPKASLPASNSSQDVEIPTASNKVVNKRSASVSEQPKLLSNLISDSSKIQDFKKFVGDKNPQNHMEIFAVLAHWMKYNLSLEDVSIDEMWTSYKVLGKKAPKVLVQVFRDGKSKKGWFNVGSSTGKYILTSFGETFVEHDLPSLISKQEKKETPQDNQLPLDS